MHMMLALWGFGKEDLGVDTRVMACKRQEPTKKIQTLSSAHRMVQETRGTLSHVLTSLKLRCEATERGLGLGQGRWSRCAGRWLCTKLPRP